jgi:hypothetical protein
VEEPFLRPGLHPLHAPREVAVKDDTGGEFEGSAWTKSNRAVGGWRNNIS